MWICVCSDLLLLCYIVVIDIAITVIATVVYICKYAFMHISIYIYIYHTSCNMWEGNVLPTAEHFFVASNDVPSSVTFNTLLEAF